jgi:outer membrane lipoprotein-sorting protein
MALLVLPGASYAQSAREIVSAASRPPTASFQGRRIVVNWFGNESRAHEIIVYYRAPGLWRQEILSPAGEVQKVVYQRDGQEWIHDTENGALIHRSSSALQPGRFDSRALLDVLLKNYTPRLKGKKELLSGLPCQMIELVPKSEGSPRRTIWVDADRGIVLKTRQHTARGSLVSETSFTELDLDAVPDKALFVPPTVSEDKTWEDYPRESVRGLQELEIKGFDRLPWREALPHGFRLDLVTLVPLGDDNALHFRYVDGLGVLSFFVSPRPIDGDSGSGAVEGAGHDDPTFSFSSSVGNLLTWEEDGYYCLLVADLEPSELSTIREALIGGVQGAQASVKPESVDP